MITGKDTQIQKATIALLKSGAEEIARKDAEFLQKRIDSLNKEMGLMTRLLAGTPAHNQDIILSGLEQLGDRLKSTGRAVENFATSRASYFSKNLPKSEMAEFTRLQETLTQNYLKLSSSYTALGGVKTKADVATTNPLLQKIIDELA